MAGTGALSNRGRPDRPVSADSSARRGAGAACVEDSARSGVRILLFVARVSSELGIA